MKTIIATSLLGLVLVSGCAYRDGALPLSADAGAATAANIEAQTIPAAATQEPVVTDGARMATVITQYRTNRTPKPQPLRTSDVGGTSGAPAGPAPGR